MHPRLIAILSFLLLPVLYQAAEAQVRFYAQFRSIPFREASTNNFNLLTGVKIDPNKEIVMGIGLSGSLNPSELRGDLRFNKSNFTLSFNYYINRQFYLNGELNYNRLKGIATDLLDDDPVVVDSKDLIRRFFFDYDINLTYILLRRFHLSFGTGIVDFARLARSVSSDIIDGKFQLNVSLALKVYFFQIKF